MTSRARSAISRQAVKTWETRFGRRFDSTAKLTCSGVVEWLDAYVDRELSSVANAGVGRHVAGCQNCRTLVSERTRLKRQVKTSVSSVSVPQRLTWMLQAALRREQ